MLFKHQCRSPFLITFGNFVKKRLQHRCFPVKFEKTLRTPPAAASEFCSGDSAMIVSVSNIRCARCVRNQCKSQCMINSMMLHLFQDNAEIN